MEVRPGTEIDITVRAQPNSYIGLLAIDQNVGILKSGHDILQSQVMKELGGYDIADPSPYYGIFTDKHKHFPWKPGASNARDSIYV